QTAALEGAFEGAAPTRDHELAQHHQHRRHDEEHPDPQDEDRDAQIVHGRGAGPSDPGVGGLDGSGVIDADGHDVGVDRDATALDGQLLGMTGLIDDPHGAGAEDGQGGLHLRQDAHRAVHGGHDDLRGLTRPDGAIRGDEGDVERTHAPSSLSMRCWFSSTMSIPPTLKKAHSVMWSNSLSQMPLKPSMVSLSGTSEPSTPVNCFARWVFCERNCWMRRARDTITLSSSESSSTPSIAMMSCSSLLRWRICFTRTAVS